MELGKEINPIKTASVCIKNPMELEISQMWENVNSIVGKTHLLYNRWDSAQIDGLFLINRVINTFRL